MNDDETKKSLVPPESKEDVVKKPLDPTKNDIEIVTAANVSTEERKAEERASRLASAKLDDFVVLGRYTLIVCLFSELMILCQLSNLLYMVYAGAAPNIVSCGDTVFDVKLTEKERCKIMNSFQNGSSSCTPELKAQFVSVNYEFNYYCDGTKLVKQTISLQLVGLMVGAIVFGNLSDMFGRRKIMLITLLLCLACMVVTSFTNSLFWFTFWRFLVCVFNGGTLVILMVFMVENLPKKDRFWISNIITWSPNMVLYAVIAYFSNDWRTLTRVSAFLGLPCAATLLYLCESPRFLVQSRQINAAREAILRIYRIDKKECDKELLNHVLSKEEQTFLESKTRKKYTYLHLFYTLTFARYTIAVAYSLLVTSILNYSLLFNMEKLSGSIYLNSIIMGSFRYSCNLTIAFCDRKFDWLGRKLVHMIANSFSAIALAICFIVFALDLQIEWANLARACVLSVIGICSLLYTTNGIASNELFPTCIRNTSFSFGQFFSRVGTVLAPQIFLLSDIWSPLPYLVMSIMAALDLVLFQFNVTETKGKALVDNMPSEDQRLFGRNRGKNFELLPKDDKNFENAKEKA